MSDSVRPHRRQPTRLPHPWDSPGKNTGVGCHFLLQFLRVKSESEVAQLFLTLSDPMDCSPPGSSSMGFSRQEYWSGVPLPSPYLPLLLYFSCSVSLGENSTVVLKGCFYAATFLCNLCGFNSLWCKGCFWCGCLSPLSSLYAAHYPLDRRCSWCCGDQSQGHLLFAL